MRTGKMETGLKKGILAGALSTLVLLAGIVHAPAQTSVAGNPLFHSFTRGTGDFTLTGSTRIIVDAGETELVRILSADRGWLSKLRHATGLNIQITSGVSATAEDIVLTKATNDSDFTALMNNASIKFRQDGATKNIGHNVSGEGYKYKAGSGGVTLQYKERQGGFQAFQSLTRLLMQSKEGYGVHRTLPNGEGMDYPIFEKRIAMLDVGRFFVPVDHIIAFLEKMSFHKLNVLQIHLNDDVKLGGHARNTGLFEELKDQQPNATLGFFRLEQPAGTETTFGDLRPADGNFYTREDWERIEDAAERYGIEIVPEFNSPAHSKAWIQANPQLGSGTILRIENDTHVERAAEYLGAVMNSYGSWFRSRTMHYGGEEAHTIGAFFVAKYINRLVDITRYNAESNPDGYKKFQMWAAGDKRAYDPDIEHMIWFGRADSGTSDANLTNEQKANLRWYDMPWDETYLVPFHTVSNEKWINPVDLFKFYYGDGSDKVKHNGAGARTAQYVNSVPDGLGIAFWGDRLIAFAPWVGIEYITGGMMEGVVAQGVVSWNANLLAGTGGGTTITAYADTGYDRLIPAAQELHSYWVSERFPYLSATQTSVILHTTTSYPVYYRTIAPASVRVFSPESGATKFQHDSKVISLFMQTGRRVADRSTSNRTMESYYDLRPGSRETNWMYWDKWELIKMFKGPAQFNGGMYNAELSGEGNPLSDGRICVDIGLKERAFEEFSRSVSVCDEDSWFNDISGTGGLRKSGPGKLNLHGKNTFQGDVMLEGGKLAISYDESLGLTSSVLTFAGGTLVASPYYEEMVPFRFIGWVGGPGVENADPADTEASTGYSSPVMYYGHDYSKYRKETVSTPLITIAANRRMVVSATVGNIEINNESTEIQGVISGAGMLKKTGAGKLSLKGTNTFSGGLMIEEGVLEIATDSNLGEAEVAFAGGTLSFSGATTLPASRNLVMSGDGAIDTNGYNASVMGVISGSGALTKTGTGVLRLMGSNTYTGATRVAGGVLSGESDKFIGDIYSFAGGTLEFAQSSNGEYANNIFGDGLIRKEGGGVLALKGSSSEADWEIAAGKVENEMFFSGNITFVGNSERVFEFKGNHRYAGVISGDGKMATSDGGVLLLGDSRRFAGVFDVKMGGALLVDNRLGGNVNVASGGELGGRGRIGGNVAVASGGVLNPSRGTDGRLVIDGNLDLDGNYKVTFGLGALVAGSADISSGSLMVLDTLPPLDGNIKQRFNVLIAVEGVTGRFAGADTTALPFLTLTISYESDRVQIRAGRNERELADLLDAPDDDIEFPVDEPEEPEQPVLPPPEVTPVVDQPPQPIRIDGSNTRVLAQLVTAAENIGSPGIEPLSDVFMALPADSPDGRSISERIEEILDSFVAKTHASAKAVFLVSSADLRTTAVGQTRAAFDSVGSETAQWERFSLGNRKWGLDGQQKASVLWVKMMGSKGTHIKDELQIDDMEFKGGGFLIGGDRAVSDNVRMGLFGGISKTDFEQERSDGKDDSQHIGMYAGVSQKKLGLRIGATFTRHNIDISRTVAGTPLMLAAEYKSQTYDMFAELGYQVEQNSVVFEPFAGLNYTHHAAGEYTERNVDGAEMSTYPKQSTDMSIFEAGMRFRIEVPQLPVRTRLHGMLAWHLPVKDPDIFTKQRIGNISRPVDIPGTPISGKGFVLEAGLKDLMLGDDAVLDLTYRYLKSFYYRNSSEKHSFSGKFTYSF